MALTYLYGIIPAAGEVHFDVAGVNHAAVRAIAHNDLAAVVGGSSLPDYRGLDREQVVRYLLAHQRVVEAVLHDHPVLPVKFGTVLPDESTARDLLAAGEGLFRGAMEKLTGHVQMEVVVLWDFQTVIREVSEDESVARLKAIDRESMDGRIAVGKMVYELLEKRRSTLKDSIIPILREMSRDLLINPNMDDSMVVNLAMLVERSNCEPLDRQLQALDQEFSGSLNFRRIGPLPPYSFATVEVHCPTFEEVDKARLALGLGEEHNRDEIKQAYRRLVGQTHPDVDPDNVDADGHLSELTSAYKFLMAYADSGADPAICRFDRETAQRSLMIALRRQESRE